MIDCIVEKDFVYVKTPYVERDYVSGYLNGVWNAKRKMYRFPKNIHCMRELMKQYPLLKMNPTFVQVGQSLARAVQNAIQAKEEDAYTDINPALRQYQRHDVNYLMRMPSAGVFNDPRTGKTPTIIEVMRLHETKVNLVICPASLLLNWKKEFERWHDCIEIYVVSGSKKKRDSTYERYCVNVTKTRVLIVSKDTWKLDKGYFTDFTFDMCVVDEAHFLRALAGSKSKNTSQALAVLDIKATYRFALTGTPTIKHSYEVYGILKFLYPTKFPSFWQFVDRYFDTGMQGISFGFGVVDTGKDYSDIHGVKEHRKDELQSIIAFASVQRKRKDVMAWLPDKQRITQLCQMEGKQLKLYREMEAWFTATDEDTEQEQLSAANILAQLTRLRQLCLDPRLLGFDAPSAKTEALLEWLDDNREPVVIMSMFTSYFKILRPELEKMGLKVGEIHGQMANIDKDNSAVSFQEGRYDILLCNIISAGVGFTLDRATTVIFMDKAWNPPENEQAEDRITPVDENRNHKHDIITFACADSFDDRITELLDAKTSLIEVINNGGKEALRKLLKRKD